MSERSFDAVLLLLAENDPADIDSVPDADSEHGRRLLAEILASPRLPAEKQARRRRPTVRRIAVAVGAVAILAAAWAIAQREVANPTVVVCFEQASLDSDRVGLVVTSLSVEECASVWEAGDLANPDVDPGTVPDLTGCVTEEGVLAVFPSDDAGICADLGLSVFDRQSSQEHQQVVDLHTELVDYFAAADCTPLDRARADIEDILAGRGFDDWEVVVAPGPVDRPCATLAFDPEAQRVLLVPFPEP